MKPSERIADIHSSNLKEGLACYERTSFEFKQMLGQRLVAPAIAEFLDEQAELERKRFEFLLQVIEDGEVAKLKELAKEKGLL